MRIADLYRALARLPLVVILSMLFCSSANAVDGYDHWNHTRISIIAGDKIAVGEDLGIYIWNIKQFAAVEIENLVVRGRDLEIEVTDRKSNKFYFFEIATDDPGLARLPEFDPGLPYPEILTPELHMKHDLLGARGNMVERGNQINRGNQVERGNRMHQSPTLGDPRLMNNEHLLYQGFQPSE